MTLAGVDEPAVVDAAVLDDDVVLPLLLLDAFLRLLPPSGLLDALPFSFFEPVAVVAVEPVAAELDDGPEPAPADDDADCWVKLPSKSTPSKRGKAPEFLIFLSHATRISCKICSSTPSSANDSRIASMTSLMTDL